MATDFPQSAKEEAARLSEGLSQIKGKERLLKEWYREGDQVTFYYCLGIFL